MAEVLLFWDTRWRSGAPLSAAGAPVAGVTAEGTCLKEAWSLKRQGHTPTNLNGNPKSKTALRASTTGEAVMLLSLSLHEC